VVQIESRYEDVNEYCENLYAENIRSPYLLAFMIDILEDQLETKSCQDTPQTLGRALEVCCLCAFIPQAHVVCPLQFIHAHVCSESLVTYVEQYETDFHAA